MVESSVITRLSQMMQAAISTRNEGGQLSPFGGVQVIVTGDLYQLPPVLPFQHCQFCGQECRREEPKSPTASCEKHGDFDDDEKWAFASPVWSACNFEYLSLQQVHRQRDPVFQSILEDLRMGLQWTAEQENILLNHPNNVDAEFATKLFPRRKDVDAINARHMDQIEATAATYHSVDNFKELHDLNTDLAGYEERVDGERSSLKVLAQHRYSHELDIKLGMLVILLANLDTPNKLTNGTAGKVVGWVDMSNNLPCVQGGEEDKETHRGQFIQGRYKHYKQDRIRDFEYATPQAHKKWPVVQFSNGIKRVIFAQCLVQEVGRFERYSLLSRTQIPLIAGWAITVHKSQGLTLDNVIVDLDRCFVLGQAYVVLSRARSLETLKVRSLPKPQYVGPDPVVEEFMERVFGTRDEFHLLDD